MEHTILYVYPLVEVAAIGAFLLLYPPMARKGLLFGVYVGEERSRSDEAHAITRDWYKGMIAAIAIALTSGVASCLRPGRPFGTIVSAILLGIAFVVLYLVAYRRALRLASELAPATEVAPAGIVPEQPATFPWLVLICSALVGVSVIAYTAARFDAMPDPVPTHFGVTGQPDHWSKKTIGSVMVLPIMTLIMGITMGGAALLTARAKRGLRLDDGASLAAQNRYRSAMSRFLAILGLLVTTMLASLSVAAVQVALGQRQALPGVILLVGLAVFLYAMIGAGWLVIRYGQGGARLENAQANAPLTNGLADNRLWKLGVFYVDRNDPSWLVEHRFGFGYTLNFGNPRAVVTFAVFLAAILGLAVWAIVSSG